MGGLSSNVTMGPGVAPVPSQINVPPGPDEPTFGEAFAEAQTKRLGTMDQQDSTARAIPPVSLDRPGAMPPAAPSSEWRPISRASGSSIQSKAQGDAPADANSPATSKSNTRAATKPVSRSKARPDAANSTGHVAFGDEVARAAADPAAGTPVAAVTGPEIARVTGQPIPIAVSRIV